MGTMKYTIVWNKNKTEGIILSGEDRLKDAEHACNIKDNTLTFGVTKLAYDFRENVGKRQKCIVQEGLVPLQPTTEMIKAGIDAWERDEGYNLADVIESIYKAMIGMMK